MAESIDSNYWHQLIEQRTDNVLSTVNFWSGLRVWVERPHLLNRKLLATEVLNCSALPDSEENLCINFKEENFQHFLQLFENNNESFKLDNTENTHQCFKIGFQKRFSESDLNKIFSTDDSEDVVLLIRKLIPRNVIKFSEVLEMVLIDKKLNIVIFWPKQSDVVNSEITPKFPYRIRFRDHWVVIEAYYTNFKLTVKEKMSEEWLKSCVLPKIVRWSNSLCTTGATPSLSLVSPKSYAIKHNYLKQKYARKYIESWPEISDPLKYVHEDISIAAYLMTIWEKEMTDLNLASKQTFVDLGCGNGLLVDLLVSEGYTGIGIDVRKRKIWDLYENSTSLVEKTIEPSDYNIFPNYDWIIGNHSDELTPWIPVIAARSSYKMKVFLLPCCAFTFNGKFERCSEKTQYQSYLLFIRRLCENMGFVVEVDRLRIPSTKRTCFVCASRNYDEKNEKNVDVLRNNFIKSHSRKKLVESCVSKDDSKKYAESKETISKNENLLKESKWIEDFKPRERTEVVKNCSQLDREFINTLILTVAKLLLQTENYISLVKGSETLLWNAGGKMKFNELISKIDLHTMKSLKKQNGGFQTLLRNHKSVFCLTGDDVQLNIPVKGNSLNIKPVGKKRHRKKQYNFKEKPCFFFFHHPQGCPLESSDCNFSHKTN